MTAIEHEFMNHIFYIYLNIFLKRGYKLEHIIFTDKKESRIGSHSIDLISDLIDWGMN